MIKPASFAFFLLGVMANISVNAADINLSFVDLGSYIYRIEGSFSVAASSVTAWEVLSDYEHIPDFVPSMLSSRIKTKEPDSLLLEQKSLVSVLFLRREIGVELRVHEDPCRTIQFEDISKRTFKFYKGSWNIETIPDGVLVIYRLILQDAFSGPRFVIKRTSKRTMGDLLERVRKEISRRSSLPSQIQGPVCH